MKKRRKWAIPLERCTLHLRDVEHVHPDRRGETIVEVRRGDEVLATIYGAREGVHVISELNRTNSSFFAEGMGPMPAVVVPLLREDDICPWCNDTGRVEISGGMECPACRARRAAR